MALQANGNPDKKPRTDWIILVYTGTIAGKHFSHFFHLILQKEKQCGHMNSLLQHGHISKLLTLKADAQYLKNFQKKIPVWRNLGGSSKAIQTTRLQDRKAIK